MFKNPLVLVISVLVLALFAGCKPKQVEKGEKVGPPVVQPAPANVQDTVEDDVPPAEPTDTPAIPAGPQQAVPESDQPGRTEPYEPAEDMPGTVTEEVDEEEPDDTTDSQDTEPQEAIVLQPDEPNDARADATTGDSEQTEQPEQEPGEVEVVAVEPNEPAAEDANEPGPQTSEPNQPAQIVVVEPNVPEEADANEVVVAVEPNEIDANGVIIAVVEPNDIDANEVAVAVVDSNTADVNETTSVADTNDVEPPLRVTFHDKCSSIFEEYVKLKGLVDYGTLSRRRLELKAVLRQFEDLDRKEYESWPKADKIAFWINAYNLKMMDIIARNYPIVAKSRYTRLIWGANSIRHIGDDLKATYKFIVMDEEFTLQRIERELFKKEFDDPRIFLAISQGCLSGPPLSKEPYRGQTLDKQLEAQVRRFILDNDLAFAVDRENSQVRLSMFLSDNKDMYGGEFLKKFAIDRKFRDHDPVDRAVLNFLARYLPESVVRFLETGNYEIKPIPITWTVNDAP